MSVPLISQTLTRLTHLWNSILNTGGILDQEQIQIGVVNGIVGIERYTVTIQGTKNHAGTTPMYLRDDAMTKAANLIVELEQLAREIDRDMVCTVGWLNASPGVAKCHSRADRDVCGSALYEL